MFNFFNKTDAKIQQDVISEIKWDPRVTSTQVSVLANDGIVTLRGSVPHYFEKSKAEDAAWRVGGVRAVVDDIDVNMMGSYLRSDEQIAEAGLGALRWNSSVPAEVKLTVEKGWITLKGETDWDFQRTNAKECVSQLMGVRGVTNNIILRSQTSREDIKTRIEEALVRSAEAEGRKIKIDVKGDKVILTGNVHSFAEKSSVRRAAWMAPGIMTVEDNLKIET